MPTNDRKPASGPPADIRRVLLGTDLGPASELATDRAFDLAHRHGADLLVVSVIDPNDLTPAGRAASAVAGTRSATGAMTPPGTWWLEAGRSGSRSPSSSGPGTRGRRSCRPPKPRAPTWSSSGRTAGARSGACFSVPSPTTSCATRPVRCSSFGPRTAGRTDPPRDLAPHRRAVPLSAWLSPATPIPARRSSR